jgi:hypothetical protein
VSDELEPVEQRFEADLSDYIEPIQDASDETEGFADVVEQATENLSGLRDSASETGGSLGELGGAADDADASLDGLAASGDDATASTDALGESVGSLRDKVYEAYPGIDEATASLLAEASAAEAGTAANEEYAGSLGAAQFEANGLYATLASIKDILGAAELGESLTVGVTGLNRFLIETEDDAENAGVAFTGLRTGASLLDDAMLSAANSTRDFWEAVNALDPALAYSENIATDAAAALQAMGATGIEAAAGAAALADAQAQWDANIAEGAEPIIGGLISLLGNLGVALVAGGGSFADFGGEVSDALAEIGANLPVIAVEVAVLLGPILAALTEAGALVTGLSAAVTGLVPFAALAIPAFKSVAGAIDDTRRELDKLPPAERATVLGIRDLKSGYEDMAKAFEPDMFRLFNQGVRIAEDLLPTFRPLADDAADGISKLLAEAEKFFKIPADYAGERATGRMSFLNAHIRDLATPPDLTGWQEFLKEIGPDISPAIQAIGGSISNLVLDWGKFIERFSPKDIQNAFHVLNDIVNWWSEGFGHAISQVMNMWDDFSAAWKNSENWYNDVQKVAYKIQDAFAGIEQDALSMGADVVSSVEKNWDASNRATERYWTEIGHDVEDATDAVRETVITAGHDIEHYWDDAWSTVVSFTEHIPGALEHIFAGAGSWLTGAGREFIEGLINGIESMLGPLESVVEHAGNLAKEAWDWITGSHSPSQEMHLRGVGFVDGLIEGIESREGALHAAVAGLAGGSLAAFGSSSSSAAPSVHVTVPMTLTPGTQGYSDPAFVQYLQREVQEAVLRYQLTNPGNGLTRIVPGIRA